MTDPLDNLLLGQLPIQRFGEWDAPMFDDQEVVGVPVPKDRVCMYCHDPFVDGDNGAIMPTNLAQHRECGLRGVMGGIGHQVDCARYCRGELGTDAGLSYRESSKLVWRWFTTGALPTEDELGEVRRAS